MTVQQRITNNSQIIFRSGRYKRDLAKTYDFKNKTELERMFILKKLVVTNTNPQNIILTHLISDMLKNREYLDSSIYF